MPVTIRSDGVLERVAAKLASLPSWMPAIVERHMADLGGNVAEIMEGVIEPNRYKGDLQSSIVSRYVPTESAVHIHPMVERGAYDGGTILELGTGPIVNAPWAPIAAWADFRGIPAYPVWYTIRTLGVLPHPFLKRTMDDPATVGAMNETATRIALDAALEIVEGSGAAGANIAVNR